MYQSNNLEKTVEELEINFTFGSHMKVQVDNWFIPAVMIFNFYYVYAARKPLEQTRKWAKQ